MIPLSRLHEFGFETIDQLPKHLSNHAVTLSLPTAVHYGLEPIEVVIEDGLVIPSQSGALSGGMIVRRDGSMLYVGHKDAKDPRSPLESHFTREIPYDARVEVVHVMRRAVAADPSLTSIWSVILQVWSGWFSAFDGEGDIQAAGDFKDASGAWSRMGELLDRLVTQFGASPDLSRLNVKFIVQLESELRKGWLGEESLVDSVPLDIIADQGRVKFMYQHLFPKLQKALRSPLFSSSSTFRICYGTRQAYIIKLVVVLSEGQSAGVTDSVGIDLVLDNL